MLTLTPEDISAIADAIYCRILYHESQKLSAASDARLKTTEQIKAEFHSSRKNFKKPKK